MKKMAALLMAAGLILSAGPVLGADIENMSNDELKEAYLELKSEKEQLESENAELKERIEALENEEETETEEPSTEVVGTVYTDQTIVKIVQKALNDAGFDCGTPDGIAGSGTAAALRSYQQSKGINVNGVITDELLESLGVADEVEEQAKKEAQMNSYSSDYSYNQLARDPDSYIGTKVKFRGKVLQEGDAGSGYRYIRLAVNSDYDTVMFVTYEKSQVSAKILEDDIITIYGSCEGDYSYETVMGAEVTLPWVHSDIIDMSEVNM